MDLESTIQDGDVFYSVTNDNSETLQFTNRVSESFRDDPDFIGFTASQLLIVTWDRVKEPDTNKVCSWL